jgi:hypothetical protein
MKPHIAACLEDIEERITDLTNIRDQIVNLFGGKPETGPQLLLQNKAIQRKIDRNDKLSGGGTAVQQQTERTTCRPLE